jgi:2-dehydropantoate 2-reductase
MRILIVGAGSTGGYFGGRLAQAGRDVTFLVRATRAAQLRTNGLQIQSPHGDVTLTPKLVTAGAIDGPYDAILLTVKGFALDAALDDIAPAVGPDTLILPVLNGMKHVDAIVARFGAHAFAGCVCKVATLLDDDGRIVQFTKLQDMAYGEMDGTRSARIEALDRAMQGAGFDARLSETIERDMWEKWILLATIGGVTNLMRGAIGEIVAVPGGAEFARAFLDEVVAVVTGEGHPPSEPFVTATQAAITQPGSPLTSSMYRDLMKGRPVEVDQILGDLLARARRLHMKTPLLAAATVNLLVYQDRAAAG